MSLLVRLWYKTDYITNYPLPRSVFLFSADQFSTLADHLIYFSFRSLILLILTPPVAPSISSFFTLIQTSILKNSQPEPTDFL